MTPHSPIGAAPGHGTPALPSVLQCPSDWADAVAALPAAGKLPIRTILVPSERHAHVLRRALVRSGRQPVLAGTRFVAPLMLAQELLAAAGVELHRGEETSRAARLSSILASKPTLEHFDLSLLCDMPGWPEAFASAIGDLEDAGWTPERLPSSSAHWRDLRLLWRLLDDAAGTSITAARIFTEATAVLDRDGRAPFSLGAVLAAVTGREPAAELGFLRALPGTTLAIFAARPVRGRHLDRLEELLGPAARSALERAPLPPLPGHHPLRPERVEAGRREDRPQVRERDLLVRYLFAAPERLADASRPRSEGPDGTVELSEHAGVEGEIEAAAEWVAREVFTSRTPLAELAILLPSADPLAALVASRLRRLPFAGGPFPVYVAGGLPLSGSAGGSRALALLRALGSFLPAESMATLLPALRVPLDGRKHLTHAEASSLAWSLGTVGGNTAHREGALQWAAGAASREARLEQEVAALAEDSTREEREGWNLRAKLEIVRAARPALVALVELARRVVEGEPLSALGPAVCEFLARWVLDPSPDAPVHALLRGALEASRSAALDDAITGAEAVARIEQRLASIRVPTSRFGEPAVYVGTIAAAEGLEFQAVRVLGLAEGTLPSACREDPVLPDRMRQEADAILVPLAEDRAAWQLQSFDRALRGARHRVALSVPRSDLERSEREASSLLVDAAAALGRPDPASAAAIPGLTSLLRTSFAPARAEAAAFREGHPLTATAWQERAARTGGLHPSWAQDPHLDLARIRALGAPEGLGPAYGLLGDLGPFPPMPGIDPRRPISASQLEKLLACPLGFLFERILHLRDPEEAPSVRELDARIYGKLLHDVVERFYRGHGEAFVARRDDLGRWKALAHGLADRALEDLLDSYPLVGAAIRQKERGRLLRDLDSFLEYDRGLPLTRFVGVELPFGSPEPLVLDAGGIPLHVRGYVDRIDVEGGHALLRDLKTGKDHPRSGDEEEPTPCRDVQLGLYGLVAKELARAWGLPPALQAAYVYVRNGEERAFRDDHDALEQATRSWLALAARLLSGRSFPPTPAADGCTWCSFRPVCGQGVAKRAAAAAEDAEGAVAEFLRLEAAAGP